MRRPTRVATAALTLTLALALALTGVAAPPAGAVTQRTTLAAIEKQVMCVTCGIPLEVAESPAADRERAFIQQLIGQGDTAAKIRSVLVSEYGDAVLALPPDNGFNVTVYLIPIAALAAALAVLALLLPRWRRRRRRDPAAGSTAGDAISASEAARLDADLARFEG